MVRYMSSWYVLFRHRLSKYSVTRTTGRELSSRPRLQMSPNERTPVLHVANAFTYPRLSYHLVSLPYFAYLAERCLSVSVIPFILSSLSLYVELSRMYRRSYIIYIRSLFVSTPQSISFVRGFRPH